MESLTENKIHIKRVSGLDFIKIIATMLIVFHHYQQVMDIQFASVNFDRGDFYFGYLVELFFIISGFVIVYGKRNDRIIKDFLHKIFRIYPMCTAANIAYCIAILFFFLKFNKMVYRLNFEILIKSFLLIYQPNVIALKNPTWYLCVLIHCYLMWEIIRFICRDNRKKELVFAFILIFGFTILKFLNFFPDLPVRGYIPFWIGVAIAHLQTKRYYIKGVIVVAVLSVLSTLVFLHLGLFKEFYRILLVYLYWPLVASVAILISDNLIFSNNVEWIKKGAVLSWIIYIWHGFCLNVIKWSADEVGIAIPQKRIYMIITYVLIVVWSLGVWICSKKIKAFIRKEKKNE